MEKPEIVLGVLDKNNKPIALIHFMEGSTKRGGKRIEVAALQKVPLAEPSPSI